MPVLPLVRIGNPVLRNPCREVELQKIQMGDYGSFIQDMIEAMRDAEGVGLAANQVGRDLKIIVLECKLNPRYPEEKSIPLAVYFNPKIISSSKETVKAWEGCLSIPGYRGAVSRYEKIIFEAVTPDGKKVREEVQGFHARIIQHEVDHIEGRVYMDRMNGVMEWMHLEEFNRQMQQDIPEKES